MSSIIKTKGIVLRKVNFGDTSAIVTFFTEDFGKLSAIKKGARSAKSRAGYLLDVLNLLEIVIYKKETRDVQLISQVSLLKHYRNIKEDIEKFKYALAIVELLEHFVKEEEAHALLFRGTVKIFELIEQKNSAPLFLFVKYFIFFMREIGYEMNFKTCSICNRKIENEDVGYNFEGGTVCNDCVKEHYVSVKLEASVAQLFEKLKFKNSNISFTEYELSSIVKFLEKFLTYVHPEFSGIKTLRIY